MGNSDATTFAPAVARRVRVAAGFMSPWYQTGPSPPHRHSPSSRDRSGRGDERCPFGAGVTERNEFIPAGEVDPRRKLGPAGSWGAAASGGPPHGGPVRSRGGT